MTSLYIAPCGPADESGGAPLCAGRGSYAEVAVRELRLRVDPDGNNDRCLPEGATSEEDVKLWILINDTGYEIQSTLKQDCHCLTWASATGGGVYHGPGEG